MVIKTSKRNFMIALGLFLSTILILLPKDQNKIYSVQAFPDQRPTESKGSTTEFLIPNLETDSIPPNVDSTISSLLSASRSTISSTTDNKTDRPNQCFTRNDFLWSQNSKFHDSAMCSRLFSAVKNSSKETGNTLEYDHWTVPGVHTDWSMLQLVSNCTQFFDNVPFPTEPGSKEESDYPLAYVFMANRNAAQTVRLFRMIYQPQNVYCVAYDNKGTDAYKRMIISLTSCFPNVHLTPEPESIYYFGYSIIHSVMTCVKVLHDSPIPWRYIQVVSWNDFPLRTNQEMVKIFKILNGSQDSELLRLDTPDYITYKDGVHGGTRLVVPPNGLTLYKGSFANALSRKFIEFTLTDPTSLKLLDYLKDTKCAEEFYWPTLVHNLFLKPPGGFPGQCETFYTNAEEKKPFLSRFQIWEFNKNSGQCQGKFVFLSCLYGVRDLGLLLSRPEFIAHKIYEEYQPALAYCLEEWYWQQACTQKSQLDWKFYDNLPSVRYHRLSDKEKEKFVCTL